MHCRVSDESLLPLPVTNTVESLMTSWCVLQSYSSVRAVCLAGLNRASWTHLIKWWQYCGRQTHPALKASQHVHLFNEDRCYNSVSRPVLRRLITYWKTRLEMFLVIVPDQPELLFVSTEPSFRALKNIGELGYKMCDILFSKINIKPQPGSVAFEA